MTMDGEAWRSAWMRLLEDGIAGLAGTKGDLAWVGHRGTEGLD
ncbi:hypothetical protein [Chromobacterium phragmitis]|nr:hypothetical protein [Chromobacterium phragmitis]